MSSSGDFAKMVPGFEFLQGLMKNAGSAIPGMNQWIAPTLDPAELDKRIDELRTVQFWLEQNARMLATTIQALEVQRMTLSTLKNMNVPVADVAEAFKIKTPPAPAPAPAPEPTPKAAPRPDAAATGASPGVVDPMQWWGALTQQFTELAAKTLKESAADAARNMAAVKTAAAAKPAPVPASRKAAPSKTSRSTKASTATPAKTPRTRRAG